MKLVSTLTNKYKNMNIPTKAALWYAICNIIQKGISFFVVPIYVRLLTIEEYGRYSTFQSWREILIIFATLNLYCGVFTRGLIKHSEDKDRYTSSIQSLGSIFAILFLCIYMCGSNFWNTILELDTITMVLMGLYFIFNPAFNFWSTKQRVEYKYKKMVFLTLVVCILIPAVCLLLLYFTDFREKSLIWGYLIVQTLVGFIFYIYNLVKGKCFFDKKYWKEGIKFNIPLIPHYLSLVILSQCDRIMIKKMCGDADAGIYNFAYQIAIIMNVFVSAINNALVPWQYEKIKKNEEKAMGNVCSNIAMLIAFISFLIIMVAPEIVMILGTKEYMKAIWVIPPIALSTYFSFVYGLFSTVEFYYGSTQYVTIASMIGAVVNIVLNYIFINIFGFAAAGFTSLFCYILFMLLHYLFMRKVCKKLNREYKIYNTRFLFLFGIVVLFMIPIFMIVYNYIIVRYILILLMFILAIIFRNKIFNLIKSFLKKEENKKC